MGKLSPTISWLKANKLTAVLLLIVAYFLLARFSTKISTPRYQTFEKSDNYEIADVTPAAPRLQVGIPSPTESTPRPEIKERKVVQESSLSLLVANVRESIDRINQITTDTGGYMVNSNLNRPDEASFGTIIVRVPSEKLQETLKELRALSVKVVSENLSGRDVTDEYENLDERLRILQSNKERLEEIMGAATTVEEILTVQEKIFTLQDRIDNIVGRQKYLEQTAKTAKIAIYLSTDELALPYSPQEPWRPQVIFKLAVRSLLTNLQRLGTLSIWLAVYAVVAVPLAIIVYLIYNRYQHRKTQ